MAVYGLRAPRLSGLYVADVMSSAGAFIHATRYRCVLTFIGQRISPSLLLVAVEAMCRAGQNAFDMSGIDSTSHEGIVVYSGVQDYAYP